MSCIIFSPVAKRHAAATPSKKQRTHQRIVKSAAEALRRDGFDALSVGRVMKDAGLTHGGFYAHFRSREALLRAAFDSAIEDSLAALQAPEAAGAEGSGLRGLVQRYLSDAHVKHPEAGCALAAVGAESRRQSKSLRKLTTLNAERMLTLIEAKLAPPAETRRERALVTLSALVGALAISRATSDAALSRELRDAVARALLEPS